MNYWSDYQKMIDQTYINDNNTWRLTLLDPEAREGLFEAYRALKRISEVDGPVAERLLKKMTLVGIYSAVLKMKINFNIINDAKNSERKYVQARGAVPFEKGKRKWVGQYLGSVKEVMDEKGQILPRFKAKGEDLVRNKVFNLLKEELGV